MDHRSVPRLEDENAMKYRALGCIGVATALSVAAQAGETASAEVSVDLVLRRASGDLVTARYEANAIVKMQCSVQVFSPGGPGGSCIAVDAAGDSITTNVTTNADMIAAMNGISDHSYVSFSWDAQNNLTRLLVIKGSIFTPANLTPNP
jgi:hypothetical protein